MAPARPENLPPSTELSLDQLHSPTRRTLRWIGLAGAAAVLVSGVIIAVVVFSKKPDAEKGPIGGRPVSVAERERRRNLARQGERAVIEALKPEATGFGIKTT